MNYQYLNLNLMKLSICMNVEFITDVQRSIAAADMIFISVNTPIKLEVLKGR